LRACGIHDSPHIVHALLERGGVQHWIGEAGPAAVEVDHAREGGQALEKAPRRLVLPEQFDVRRESIDADQIEAALAKDLVGEVYVPTSGVFGLRSDRGCGLCVDNSAFVCA